MLGIDHHERSLIGMAMVDPTIVDAASIDLAGYQWLDATCGRVWPTLCQMRQRGEPIADVRIVAANLGNRLADVGGLGELVRLVAERGMVGQESYHIGKLTDYTSRLRFRRIAEELRRLAEDDKQSPEAIAAWVGKELNSAPATTHRSKSVAQLMREAIQLSRNPSPPARVFTGLPAVDQVTGGFRPGQLAILAARPSLGKSALASQIAVDNAKQGRSVLFVSLEMSATECVARVLSSETGLSVQSILNGELQQSAIASAERVAAGYESVPLIVEDRRGLTIDRLAAIIRQHSAQRRLDLVVVDYIGLVTPTDRRKPRWESISEISHELKSIALSEQLPILALCQLNRESEGETPKLSHLRDSGSIEQDADVVFLLDRERGSSTEATLIIAKQRNGATGKIRLTYDAKRFRFDPWVGEYNDFNNR
jgi:replicative DNA helicase